MPGPEVPVPPSALYQFSYCGPAAVPLAGDKEADERQLQSALRGYDVPSDNSLASSAQ